jgi:hypothetical protein
VGRRARTSGDVTVDGDLARVVAELRGAGHQSLASSSPTRVSASWAARRNSRSMTTDGNSRPTTFGVLRTFLKRRLPASDARTLRDDGQRGRPHLDTRRFALRHEQVRGARLAEALHGDLQSARRRLHADLTGFRRFDIRRVDNRGGLHPHASDPIPPWLRMKTEQAARIMVNGILRGKREVVVTFHAKVTIFVARHLPRLTRYLLVRSNRGSRPEPHARAN